MQCSIIFFIYLMLMRFKYFVNGHSNTDIHTVEKMIESEGYPYEAHEIITEDGYILTAHRIPHCPKPVKHKKGPVLLVHGIMCSSADYVILGSEKSLAFLLSDEGYDVWIGNARGNKYSRKHKTLDPDKDKQFWDFSWHEIGIYDIPATIDHILDKTDCDSLNYVGHSQGCTDFFVMTSERPEYNQKIRSMHAMGPAASLYHVKSPLIRGMGDSLLIRNLLLGEGSSCEFVPSTQLTKLLGQGACRKVASVKEMCENMMFLTIGYDSEKMNETILPKIMANVPAGISTKQIVHYSQGTQSNKFRQFDHGWFENQKRYGHPTPPDYCLEKITCPISIYYGENDWITAPEDVEHLASSLPNLIELYLVPFPKWTHMDFLWADGAVDLVYVKLINNLNNYAY